MIADPLELEVVSGGTVTVETPTDEVTVAADTPETIVLSTRTEGQGLPGGGTAGQALLKTTDDDFDADWGDIVGGTGAVDSVNGATGVVVLDAADVGAQPSDSDLTAIAALTTTSYGRALLELADAAAGRTALGLGTAATSASGDFQPVDSDLTAIAALTTTSFGRALLALADAAAGRTALGLGTAALSASGDFQPSDSDLTSIAALTTTSYGRAFLALADAAAGRTALGLGTAALSASTDFQPVDSDLTSIAALTTTSYGRALLTLADLAALRAVLGTGTPSSSNFLRGDGTWSAASAPVRRRVVAAARLNTSNVQGTPLWPLGNAATTTIAIPLGGLYVIQADIDSQQTGVTLVVPITATSATGAQVLTIVGYAMDTDGLPTGTPLFTTNVPAASTGNIASSTTVALPAQPFFVGVLNPSGNAGTVTVTATVPPTHTAWASATNTRSALTASSLASPPDVTTNGTTWTIDSSSTSTKWAVQASMPIVLGRA